MTSHTKTYNMWSWKKCVWNSFVVGIAMQSGEINFSEVPCQVLENVWRKSIIRFASGSWQNYTCDREKTNFSKKWTSIPAKVAQVQTSTSVNGQLLVNGFEKFLWDNIDFHCPLKPTRALCSRNFQNVKLKLDFVEMIILPPVWFYVKSNFGEFKRSKMSFLAIWETQNFEFW